jgi:hypothetical protein
MSLWILVVLWPLARILRSFLACFVFHSFSARMIPHLFFVRCVLYSFLCPSAHTGEPSIPKQVHRIGNFAGYTRFNRIGATLPTFHALMSYRRIVGHMQYLKRRCNMDHLSLTPCRYRILLMPVATQMPRRLSPWDMSNESP